MQRRRRQRQKPFFDFVGEKLDAKEEARALAAEEAERRAAEGLKARKDGGKDGD